MMQEIMAMLGFSHRHSTPSPEDETQDRQLRALRTRLSSETIGLTRAKILLRTELINEMMERRERPPK